MKIALIGYLHGNGGAERQITMLSNELAERGNEVHLIALAECNVKYEISKNVYLHDCSDPCKNFFAAIIHRYMALKKLYKTIKPEVSIHYWLQSAYLTAFIPGKIRGRIIYSERGDPGDDEYSGLLKYVREWAFRRIDGFVFQSKGARDFFDQKVSARSRIICNSVAVPTDAYTVPSQKREKRIVSVGRLHPQKNHSLLIDAFSKISGDFSDYILEIYGDGELRSDLQSLIDCKGLSERIFLRGSCKNIFERIYDASLFVLSSDFEGMPNALLEAMALGIPCISTDCKPGGARALIQDGENGLITPRANAEVLAEKMAILLTDREKAEALATKAQNVRVTNSGKEIFNQWNNFVEHVVRGE